MRLPATKDAASKQIYLLVHAVSLALIFQLEIKSLCVVILCNTCCEVVEIFHRGVSYNQALRPGMHQGTSLNFRCQGIMLNSLYACFQVPQPHNTLLTPIKASLDNIKTIRATMHAQNT